MSISTGDVLRIAVSMLFTDGNLAMNVFNAVVTNGGGPWDDADIVDDALTWMNALYAFLSSSITDELDGSEITVYVYDAIDDDWDEVGTVAFTFNPTSSADALPRGVAALINVRTIDPDTSGKKYFPGLTEPSSDNDGWVAAFITILADVAAAWVTAFVGGTSGADWTPVIWSPTETTPRIMTGAFTIPTEQAYQRRRKRGVGA